MLPRRVWFQKVRSAIGVVCPQHAVIAKTGWLSRTRTGRSFYDLQVKQQVRAAESAALESRRRTVARVDFAARMEFRQDSRCTGSSQTTLGSTVATPPLFCKKKKRCWLKSTNFAEKVRDKQSQ